MHAWIWKVIHELRDGPLEKLREGGWGIFEPEELFSLSNSL